MSMMPPNELEINSDTLNKEESKNAIRQSQKQHYRYKEVSLSPERDESSIALI